MNKEDFNRYEQYLKTGIGAFDESMCSMQIAAQTTFNAAHVVEINADGNSYLFERSESKDWARDTLLSSIIDGLKEDRKEEYAAACISSRPFTFSKGEDATIFSNFTEFPRSRNVVNDQTSQVADIISPALARAFDKGLVHTYGPISRNIVDITKMFEIYRENDHEKVRVFLDHHASGVVFGNTLDEPVLTDSAGAFLSGLVPGEMYYFTSHDAAYTGHEADQIFLSYVLSRVGINTVEPQIHQSAKLGYLHANIFGAFFQDKPVDGPIRMRGGTSSPTNTAFEDNIAQVMSELRAVGIKVTGRVFSVGSSDGNSAFSNVVYDGETRPLHAGPGLMPYYGPGRGQIIVQRRVTDDVYSLEVEHTFNSGHDVLWLRSTDPNKGIFTVTEGTSVWAGGAVRGRDSFESSRLVREALCASPFYSSNGMDADVKLDEFSSVDPFTKISLPTVDEVIASVNTLSSRPTYVVHGAIWRRMQLRPSRDVWYHPISGFLHQGRVAFVGAIEVDSDLSLLTLDGSWEGAAYEQALERPEVKDNPGFGAGDDGAPLGDAGFVTDALDPEAEPGMRSTTLRYSQVAMDVDLVYISVDGETLASISNGQGVSKRPNQETVKALEGLSAELGASDLAMVGYSRAVKIPHNVTDMLVIARDYAKAKKKACQTNDWDKQEYIKGVTWGAVKNKVNSKGSLKRVFSLTDVNDVTADVFPLGRPLSAVYRPGTSPALIDVTYEHGDKLVASVDEQDPLWETLSAGVTLTGISLAALSTSWGYEDPVEAADTAELSSAMADVRAAYNSVDVAMGRGPYTFAHSAFAAAGFPDVRYMVPDDAYKAMIATVIILEQAGGPVASAVLELPSRLLNAYRASSLVRQSKWRQNFAEAQ